MWKWIAIALIALGCSDPEPEKPLAPTPVESPAVLVPEEAPEPPPPAEPAQSEWSVQLQEGESLALLAGWANTTAEALMEHNGLKSHRLKRAQTLKIPGSKTATVLFDARREQFKMARLDTYLKRKGEPSLVKRKVRRGDSLGRIARRHRLPLWVLIHFNAERDLDRLNVGDTVVVPAFGAKSAALR